MSSAYDPRRSRPRPAQAPDPEAAPIDALLGPEPESTDAAGAGIDSAGRSVSPPTPVSSSRSGAPSALVQLLPLLVVGSLVAALVWWLTRRRSAD